MEDQSEKIPLFDDEGNIIGTITEDMAVDATGKKLDNNALVASGIALAKKFVYYEAQKAKHKEEMESAASEIALINSVLVKIFKLASIQHLRVDGRTVMTKRSLYASAKHNENDTSPDAALDRLKDALFAIGHGEMVKASVNAKKLASLIREYDPDKNYDIEEISENLPQVLRDAVKISVVTEMTSRK